MTNKKPNNTADTTDTEEAASNTLTPKALIQLQIDLFKAKHGLKKLRSQRTQGRNEAASAIPSNLWRHLLFVDRVKRCLEQLPESYAATIHISDKVLAKAAKEPRGVIFYLSRRMTRHLEKHLGRKVEFLVVGEVSPSGRYHLHGVFGFDGFELEQAKEAFKKSLGVWTGKSNTRQFDFQPNPDAGWVTYTFKQPNVSRETYVSRTLNARAKAAHESSRIDTPQEAIRRRVVSPVDVPKSETAQLIVGLCSLIYSSGNYS